MQTSENVLLFFSTFSHYVSLVVLLIKPSHQAPIFICIFFFQVLTNNLGHIVDVDNAETIWDKVTEDIVTFDQFMEVLESNLLVGLSKQIEVKIDEFCWTLSQRIYCERIASIYDSETGDDKKSRRNFDNTDRFRLWKVI